MQVRSALDHCMTRGHCSIIVLHHSIAKTMPSNLAPSIPVLRGSRLPHLLIWVPTLVLIALWSLLAWAGLALAGWVGWAASEGGGTGDWRAWIDAFALPAWLAPWASDQMLEAVKASLATLGPVMEWLAATMPDLLSGLTVLVVALWAVGALLLVLGGVAATVALRLWRRRIQHALAAAP